MSSGSKKKSPGTRIWVRPKSRTHKKCEPRSPLINSPYCKRNKWVCVRIFRCPLYRVAWDEVVNLHIGVRIYFKNPSCWKVYKINMSKNDTSFTFTNFLTSSKNNTPGAANFSLSWALFSGFPYFLLHYNSKYSNGEYISSLTSAN